jgi:hypothetical protein
MTQKSLIKMQISPIKNPNFEKPSRNLSKRTKVKILKKKFFGYLSKKIWFRVCSVTAEMFEHRNSGKNQRKRSEFFIKNLRRAYKDLFRSKKIQNYLMLVYLVHKKYWINIKGSDIAHWQFPVKFVIVRGNRNEYFFQDNG